MQLADFILQINEGKLSEFNQFRDIKTSFLLAKR